MTGVGRCILPHLENPHLNGILIGLDRQDSFKLKHDSFRCCGGQGMRWDEHLGSQVSCAVKRRHRDALTILGLFHRHWPGRDLPSVNAAQSAQILRDTAGMIKGKRPQAWLLKGQVEKPGIIWLIALALVWRFGVRVYFASYARRGQPWTAPSHTDTPQVILVEQWSRISDINERSQLEALISYAYNANCFLCLEMTKPAGEVKSGGENRHLAKYRMRLNQLRERPPLEIMAEFLEPDSFSELNSLCHLPRQDHHF